MQQLCLRSSFAGLFLVALVGCGSPADIGSCPDGPDTEAMIVAGEQDIVSACNGCHGFRTDQLSASRAQDIFDKVDSGSMPPGGPMSNTQIEEIRTFLACTTDAGANGAGGGG